MGCPGNAKRVIVFPSIVVNLKPNAGDPFGGAQIPFSEILSGNVALIPIQTILKTRAIKDASLSR
jgi:hypothetical protein